MAKVITFPINKSVKELPVDVEERLREIGKEYMETLYYALTTMSSEDPSAGELAEIRKLVEEAYAKGLYQALAEYEDGL